MSELIIIPFDYDAYIANPQFTLYSNPTYYPESLLLNYWNVALNYVSNVNYGDICGDKREYAIQLMMSHIIYLTNLTNTGNGFGTGSGGSPGTVPYQMQSATIDKVSVTVTPPPNPDQFQWWLGLTPFGQQLLAMLQIQTVGGQYIGGSNLRAGFLGSDVGYYGPCNGYWPWPV